MIDMILTKTDLAKRHGRSVSSIDTACSRNPSSLPIFFKLGVSKNSQIRFRLVDCIAFEAKMLERQKEELANRGQESDLAVLLDL